MRPGVENFPVAYDRPPPPSEILQEPLDGDPAHYARLCALDSEVSAPMLAEFAARQPLLEHRLAVLPDILSKPLDATLEWPPLAPDGN